MNAVVASRVRTIILLAGLVAGRGATARASRTAVAGAATAAGPIERLVGGGDRLFVQRGAEILTFDLDGDVLGRCDRFVAAPPQRHHALVGAPDAEEVLAAAGLPDDDTTPEAEDALADEGLGPPRRRARATAAPLVPRALAPAPETDAVWIASSAGMFQGDENGCRPVGLEGHDLLLVAAADGVVVTATADLLFRRSGDPVAGGADPATAFSVAAGLTRRPRALALDAAGGALVADRAGVLRIAADGSVEQLLARPADALVVCAGEAVALADDGVYRWTPGQTPVRTADRPPVRELACGPAAGPRWIGTGIGVWISPDAATWTELGQTLGRRATGAATVGDRTWLAIDDRLFPLAPDDGAVRITPSPTVAGRPLSSRYLEASALPWPLVTALFSAEQRTPDRLAWEVMLLLTFPMGHAGRPSGASAAIAAERLRRDASLARDQLELEVSHNDDDDDDDDGERDARLATVLQEREALR